MARQYRDTRCYSMGRTGETGKRIHQQPFRHVGSRTQSRENRQRTTKTIEKFEATTFNCVSILHEVMIFFYALLLLQFFDFFENN